MIACKSGRHWWLSKEDADKCCNGYVRVLAVNGPGKPLPADTTNIVIDDTPAVYGRRWVKVEENK